MTIPLPVEIDDVTLAFPANALEFMPAWDDIPEDFRKGSGDAKIWIHFQETWFALGLSSTYFAFVPIEVNGERLSGESIVRNLTAIQSSYAPKHEHKMAAVAYLASLWMESLCFGPKECSLEDIKTAGQVARQGWIEHFAGDTSNSCPVCEVGELSKPEGWVEECSNPDCDSNHPPEDPE